jgi:nicotinamidase-related amidase
MAEAERPEPVANAVHLCIDMQNIFARGGVWETPWMERVLPAIVDITARYTARTIFTRFITPLQAEDRPGRWRRYFTKWKRATRSQLPAEQLELIPALRRFAPPHRHRQARLFGIRAVRFVVIFAGKERQHHHRHRLGNRCMCAFDRARCRRSRLARRYCRRRPM